MADLWDKFFGGKFSEEPEVNAYLIQLNQDIEGWMDKCRTLQYALKETHEMMQAFYSYYAGEFRTSNDPPDTEYELRIEQNEELLKLVISPNPRS